MIFFDRSEKFSNVLSKLCKGTYIILAKSEFKSCVFNLPEKIFIFMNMKGIKVIYQGRNQLQCCGCLGCLGTHVFFCPIKKTYWIYTNAEELDNAGTHRLKLFKNWLCFRNWFWNGPTMYCVSTYHIGANWPRGSIFQNGFSDGAQLEFGFISTKFVYFLLHKFVK